MSSKDGTVIPKIKRILFTLVGLLFVIIGQMSISISDVWKISYADINIRATINIPGDMPTIQEGINLATDGDIVLIAPGTYYENILLDGKTITLASWFHTTGQEEYIEQTVIDGGRSTVIDVGTVGEETRIIGLTIQNGNDGISVNSKIHIQNNRIIDNSDGIDYESGGGICSGNIFIDNSDDGIDLDGPTEVTIINNMIRDNRDDGIEIRLHKYSGNVMDIMIRDNLISGNLEDGIQLIDYPDFSDRIFHIERNLFVGNAMAAIGFMDNGDTVEDLRGAGIPERIYIINNTFAAEHYGVVGGANAIVLNNIFKDNQNSALRRVSGDSIAAYNMLWNNGTDYMETNIDPGSTLFTDPLLDEDYNLTANSPAIDSGTATFIWQGETALDMSESLYSGAAPDMGAFESAFICIPGESRTCSSGLQGVCAVGTQLCAADGKSWGECIQDVLASTEVCDDNADNDCDGAVDCADPDCSGNPTCDTCIGIQIIQPVDYAVAHLNVGDMYYLDRGYTITSLPTGLNTGEEEWIETKNDDKSNTSAAFLEFDLSQDSTVYVGYDSRASALPDWLASSFTPTTMTIGVTDNQMGQFDVYEGNFTAGTVTLEVTALTHQWEHTLCT
jgi:hypothetical protein